MNISLMSYQFLLAGFPAITSAIQLRNRDMKVPEEVTRTDHLQEKYQPNAYFRVLISVESVLIVGAYVLKPNIQHL